MYLGIDIGTSSVKAVLMDRDQRILGSRSAGLEVSRPHPGWSEQDPESWWTACLAVLDGARRRPPEGNGGGQGHRPLRPDAWRDAARRVGQGAPALHPVERRALGRGSRRDQRAERAHHRQHRHARLHRAEADVGQAPRAGDLRQGEDRAPAEGLCPPAPHRRQGERDVGFRRHAVARDAGRATGRTRCWRSPASTGRRCRSCSRAAPRPAR